MTQRQKVSIYCWRNGTHRLAPQRIATNLQSVKIATSVKHNHSVAEYGRTNVVTCNHYTTVEKELGHLRIIVSWG